MRMKEKICKLCGEKMKVTQKEQGHYIAITTKCLKCKMGTTRELIKKSDTSLL